MTVEKKLQFAVELLKELTSSQEYLEVVGYKSEIDKEFVETVLKLETLKMKYSIAKDFMEDEK